MSVMDKTERTIDPDKELVVQAQKELPYCTIAYEKLMKQYERLIFRVCLRLLGNHDDAEDVVQEVMVKVFNYLPRFEGRSSFKTWLMQIARNTSFTLQTKLKRQRELREVLEKESSEPQRDNNVDDAMSVDALLVMLSPKDREALTMRFIAELQFEEIAEVCNISLSAAKMRVYRATDALKKKMEETEAV